MAKSYRIYKASEFAKLELDIPWLVEGLVPAYGISLIYADPKIGKSIISAQLMHSLANGVPWLGFKVPKKVNVIYLQADEPIPEWSHQLRDTLKSVQQGWDTAALPPGALIDPLLVAELKEDLKAYQFVVFDALVSLFAYPEIKSATVAGHLLQQIRNLHPGPSWVIHHKVKGQQGVPRSTNTAAAGSFALGAGVSMLYDLSPRQLIALGRVVSAKVNLKRTPEGLWVADDTLMLS